MVQRSRLLSLPALSQGRLKTAKTLVEKAVKHGKVFSVLGPYPVVRADLRARGWVEKRLARPLQRAPREEDHEGEGDEEDGHDGRCAAEEAEGEELGGLYDLMSRLVRNKPASLYWTTRRDSIDCKSLRKDQMTNHYANSATFTTKVGLCVNLRNLQWFDAADPDSFFPRCYRLGAQDEKQAFIEDFRRTACTSLLQYVAEADRLDVADQEPVRTDDSGSETQQGGKRQCRRAARRLVAAGVIDRALQECQAFLNSLEHSDIDVTMETFSPLTAQQWAEFLRDYYLVVQGALIQGGVVYVEPCQKMLGRLREVCPQLDTDGLHNIWIIKPGAMSRGRGIMCMNRLEDVLALVDCDSALIKDSKWVVQKYLERPLLVHGTKFDIRQWFLVTDWNPLTIWFYKECYLRFSTQPYSTTSLDSSVHLCNNSIQKHFRPSQARHPGLPEDNMWSCSQFQTHLREQGVCGSQWGALVVPGMQQAVIRAMRTSQDQVEPRKASFELYGADFMLGRDLRPWLLEINASPTMECSSATTARLCPAVQLDTLRVVLDRRVEADADTGGFQLLYKQAAVEVPHYVGTNLLVEGAPLRRVQPRPPARRQPSFSHSVPANLTSEVRGPPAVPGAAPPDRMPGIKPSTSASPVRAPRGGTRTRLPSLSSPGRHEGRAASGRPSGLGRRSHHRSAPEGPAAPHAEPPWKAGPSGTGRGRGRVALVPRILHCSLGLPAQRLLEAKPPSQAGLLQRALNPPHRALTQGLTSFSGPLPALGVVSLRPSSLCRRRAGPSLVSLHSLQGYKLCSHREKLSRHNSLAQHNTCVC